MNKKGQALVEFIIILPIIIIIIVSLFDYVNIVNTKMNLENKMEDIILHDDNNLDNLSLDVKQEGNIKTYTLSKKVELFSPVLSKIYSSDYEIKVSRSIKNE